MEFCILYLSEYVSDIPKVPMPPIKNKKEDIALKDTVSGYIMQLFDYDRKDRSTVMSTLNERSQI